MQKFSNAIAHKKVIAILHKVLAIAKLHTKINDCSRAYNISIAEVQTKVINCNSSNISCFLQVVHTKAIVALTKV